ncbi:MAG TPA: FtsX-like permease family protein [Salinivirga sp.]|uniref:ABC transporter permease n=1 Tax=Salinivirga sp. TaxID=1970192 RepID=UPI002B463EC4|nr:FtsX-like permease family protein [Salinivirga sp.]HKK58459.1 FtsX-like permease family protein [Salinivirga sp.]
MKDLKMAWRNLWRNKRRTLITVMSIFFGVVLSTMMGSMQEGIYGSMIDNVVKTYSGHVQIQHKDYNAHKSINNTIDQTDGLLDSVLNIAHVKAAVPRLKSYTLISNGDKTRGGMLIGIDPEKENNLTGLKQWVVKGSYLQKSDQGLLIAKNLAKHLEAELGDTIILMSQGYHGASAAGLYPVRGILEFPTPELNSMGVYLDLETTRQFFYAYEKMTEIALLADDYEDVPTIEKELYDVFDDRYNYLSWKELSPELVQFINSDKASGVLMKAILYLVIGFGILGTIMMMMAERRREMGVMVAVGMQKYRLGKIIWYETMMIGFIGVIAGFVFSLPLVGWFSANPIPITGEYGAAYEQFGMEPLLYFKLSASVFLNQALIVFLITFGISAYPYQLVRRLNTIEAIRG